MVCFGDIAYKASYQVGKSPSQAEKESYQVGKLPSQTEKESYQVGKSPSQAEKESYQVGKSPSQAQPDGEGFLQCRTNRHKRIKTNKKKCCIIYLTI